MTETLNETIITDLIKLSSNAILVLLSTNKSINDSVYMGHSIGKHFDLKVLSQNNTDIEKQIIKKYKDTDLLIYVNMLITNAISLGDYTTIMKLRWVFEKNSFRCGEDEDNKLICNKDGEPFMKVNNLIGRRTAILKKSRMDTWNRTTDNQNNIEVSDVIKDEIERSYTKNKRLRLITDYDNNFMSVCDTSDIFYRIFLEYILTLGLIVNKSIGDISYHTPLVRYTEFSTKIKTSFGGVNRSILISISTLDLIDMRKKYDLIMSHKAKCLFDYLIAIEQPNINEYSGHNSVGTYHIFID